MVIRGCCSLFKCSDTCVKLIIAVGVNQEWCFGGTQIIKGIEERLGP